MGYFTRYSLAVYAHEEDANLHEIYSHDDRESEPCDGFAFDINQIADYEVFSNRCKWYEHEQHMREYSKQHPKLVFQLHGEGEESGDIWQKWFVNGKMQTCHAKIVFDKFDPTQLQ